MGKRPRADKNKRAARIDRDLELTKQLLELDDKANKPVYDIQKKRGRDDEGSSVGSVSDSPMIEITEPKLMSRLLYTNPVCILTTCVPSSIPSAAGDKAAPTPAEAGERNAMIVSWLTPGNNEGLFLMAINKKRFSADCFLARKAFALSVPVKGQEKLVASIGSSSGFRADKFKTIEGLKAVEIGDCWGTGKKAGAESGPVGKKQKTPKGKGKGKGTEGAANPFAALEEEAGEEATITPVTGGGVAVEMAVAGCAAHVQASVVSHSELDTNHWLVKCQAERAYVHPKYWNGKCFLPIDNKTPPYLTFPGAATFAYVHP